MVAEVVKLSEIVPDERNANAHTERGTYMLRRSMERFGFLEPAVLDVNNRIIGGNHRTEAAADVLGAEDALVIDIDGDRPVFVRRRDLDLGTPEGREAAIALNRTAQVGIDFDIVVLEGLADVGVDLGDWFFDEELEQLAADAAADGGEAGERVKLTFSVSRADVGVFEQAIRATGFRRRGPAILEICRFYMDGKK